MPYLSWAKDRTPRRVEQAEREQVWVDPRVTPAKDSPKERAGWLGWVGFGFSVPSSGLSHQELGTLNPEQLKVPIRHYFRDGT